MSGQSSPHQSETAHATAVPILCAPSEHNITVQQLLEDEPLHTKQVILLLFSKTDLGKILFPETINVHCDNQKCGGIRRHHKNSDIKFNAHSSTYGLAQYICVNCVAAQKIFVLRAEMKIGRNDGICTKIYQDPPFGQPIPNRLYDIIGNANRDSFLQARRAIARGLGIGAYAYYRRIVENTKFELIDSILKVAEATNAPARQIAILKKAQVERQFFKAIKMLRGVSAIPAVLLIDGRNPLTLLHDLFSEGIHAYDDVQCLERVKEAEIILFALADRMHTALANNKEVKEAVSSILKRRSAGS